MFATYFASVKKRWNESCMVRHLEAAPLWGQNVCDIFCISEKSSFSQVLDCKWLALVSVSRFSREQDRTFVLSTKCCPAPLDTLRLYSPTCRHSTSFPPPSNLPHPSPPLRPLPT